MHPGRLARPRRGLPALGTVPLGALAGGVVGQAASPQAGLALAALGLLLVPVTVFCSPLRRLRSLAGRVPSA